MDKSLLINFTGKNLRVTSWILLLHPTGVYMIYFNSYSIYVMLYLNHYQFLRIVAHQRQHQQSSTAYMITGTTIQVPLVLRYFELLKKALLMNAFLFWLDRLRSRFFLNQPCCNSYMTILRTFSYFLHNFSENFRLLSDFGLFSEFPPH